MTTLSSLPDFSELWHSTLNWQPSPEQFQQFQQLYEKIVFANRHFNLTRITEPSEFWEKHLWDSLRGIQPLGLLEGSTDSKKIIDIGTGGGFPGLPVAIASSGATVTLLDSTRKKIAFLEQLTTELGINNTLSLVGRAEEVGRLPLYRENFDIALIRAVGAPSVCAEYALPLLRVGGVAVLYRGHWSEEETDNIKYAAQQLGGVLGCEDHSVSIEPFLTPLTQSQRHCIYLQKIAPTSDYFPRLVGVPTQQPL